MKKHVGRIVICVMLLLCMTACSDMALKHEHSENSVTSEPMDGIPKASFPDKIVMTNMYWAAPEFTITFTDKYELSFLADYEGEATIVSLTDQEYIELKSLFSEIHDFTNLMVWEGMGDTTIYCDEQVKRCWSDFTTQVELEQFLRKIKSYYKGEEYDWRVEQERGYVRYNERMLPYAYKDMELWIEAGYSNVSHLPAVENLDEIEAFDGNVYQYFARFGMDYVRKDGNRYYACYRSEDEALTVWFDRQGTKLETARSAL